MINFLLSCGRSIQNIVELVNMSHSTVQHIIKHSKENWKKKIKATGQLLKLTKCYIRFIIRKFFKYPCLSAVKVAAEF